MSEQRDNEIVDRLVKLHPIVDKILADPNGIYCELLPLEEAAVNDLATMVYSDLLDLDGADKALRQQAGLRPSDVGLLLGWERASRWQRDPQTESKAISAIFTSRGERKWLHS